MRRVGAAMWSSKEIHRMYPFCKLAVDGVSFCQEIGLLPVSMVSDDAGNHRDRAYLLGDETSHAVGNQDNRGLECC